MLLSSSLKNNSPADEKITNSKFLTDISGWTASNLTGGNTITYIQGGGVRFISPDSVCGSLSQSITTLAKPVRVTVKYKANLAGKIAFDAWDWGSGTNKGGSVTATVGQTGTISVILGGGIYSSLSIYPGVGFSRDFEIYEVSVHEISKETGTINQQRLISSNNETLNVGLRSYYKLENNFNDELGLNNLTEPVVNSSYTTGLSGQAISLPGINTQSIFKTNCVNLPLEKSHRTMVAWIKGHTYATGLIRSICGYGNNSTVGDLFRLGIGVTGKLYLWGNTNNASGNIVIDPAVWTMVAVSYDGTTLRLYVNGILDTATTLNLSTVGNTFSIGDRGSYEPWNGLIDSIGLWGRVLTLAELVRLYNNGTGLSYPFSTPIKKIIDNSTINKINYRKGCIVPAPDGVAGAISVNPAPSILRLTDNISVECWIKPTSLNSEGYFMSRLSNFGTPVSDVWALGINSSNKLWVLARGATAGNVTLTQTTQTAALNTWMHVAFTYGSDIIKLYINGSMVDSISLVGGLNVSNQPFAIGGLTINNFVFKGEIDNCRIWNVVRTQTEILANKNLTLDIATGLIGNWKLDEIGLPTIYDSSGNNNHLTGVNGSYLKNSDNVNLI